MTHEEFVNWLRDEVRSERMSESEMDDLLEQKENFDRNRSTIESQFNGRVVGYVEGNRLDDQDLHRLIRRAREKSPPNRMIYFEPIGFTLL